MRVRLGSPLRSYTAGATTVEADGATLDELLRDLDRRHPGIRFRVVDEQGALREHVTVWIRSERCRDLATPLAGLDEVVILQALSGG